MDITRRDFLNGSALAIAAALSPRLSLAQADRRHYPPALTGLRGSDDAASEVGHRIALSGERFELDHEPVSETYDLVVVGAGISGLAAAWFYRRNHPAARILMRATTTTISAATRRGARSSPSCAACCWAIAA
jgi:spermidine dehydrogenase